MHCPGPHCFFLCWCLHTQSACQVFECSSVPFVAQVVKETQSFQRVAVTRDEALAMFQENKFKVEIISNLPETATISLYRCGLHSFIFSPRIE